MKSPVLLPHEQVKAAGFAEFNSYPHLCVEVPDGGFTITARTTTGKRVTFSFIPNMKGGPAGCVDVQYHDSPAPKVRNAGHDIPTMHSIGFTLGSNTWDTRNHTKPTTLLTVLLADSYYQEQPKDA